MANALYVKGKEHLLAGDIALVANTIKAVLVDATDYSVNLSTHDALDDIPSAARVAIGTLSGKSVTNGVFDAADLLLPTVSGDSAEAIVLYKDSGVESTSWLIAYIDTATGLPVTPNGGDITIQWDNGPNKILSI
jgi:hypothetical protein